ncbi:hypothetical protein GOBAR_DD11509 [Gossypium barbadense]|nr:hypothetical protein GOBAR_DD11509 [Gossypium barbadense]
MLGNVKDPAVVAVILLIGSKDPPAVGLQSVPTATLGKRVGAVEQIEATQRMLTLRSVAVGTDSEGYRGSGSYFLPPIKKIEAMTAHVSYLLASVAS